MPATGTEKTAEGDMYQCPYDGGCSTKTIHRLCTTCREHCWDCCPACRGQKYTCPEPPMVLEYDLPEKKS